MPRSLAKGLSHRRDIRLVLYELVFSMMYLPVNSLAVALRCPHGTVCWSVSRQVIGPGLSRNDEFTKAYRDVKRAGVSRKAAMALRLARKSLFSFQERL